jgi:hypothetical protein
VNEARVVAVLGPESSHKIHCGSCDEVIAASTDGVLTFVRDSATDWKGWICSAAWQPNLPGGLWEVADQRGIKQPPLGDSLEALPAIVECPTCGAGDLFDPEQLVLRPNQLVARAHRIVRQLGG